MLLNDSTREKYKKYSPDEKNMKNELYNCTRLTVKYLTLLMTTSI